MRVIAGSASGTRLATVRSADVRPITDRVKTALFNILVGRTPGARVLDLYAGSGSIGIEALSRGAAHATLVDASRRAVTVIARNLQRTHLADRADVWQRRVGAVIVDLARAGATFDVVFYDPPFALVETPSMPQVCDELVRLALLTSTTDGLVVFRHPKTVTIPLIGGWAVTDQRHYGVNALTFLMPAEGAV